MFHNGCFGPCARTARLELVLDNYFACRCDAWLPRQQDTCDQAPTPVLCQPGPVSESAEGTRFIAEMRKTGTEHTMKACEIMTSSMPSPLPK